jgi:hypothetical protein
MIATVLLLPHTLPLCGMAAVWVAAGIAPGVVPKGGRSAKKAPKESASNKERRDRHGDRGVPPPASFSLENLSDDAPPARTSSAAISFMIDRRNVP